MYFSLFSIFKHIKLIYLSEHFPYSISTFFLDIFLKNDICESGIWTHEIKKIEKCLINTWELT